MGTQATSRPMTADELSALPAGGLRYELVRGKLRTMSPAGSEHSYLAAELAAELRNHVKAQGLGRVYAAETGFKLASNPATVRAPNIAFVSNARLEQVGHATGYFLGPLELAVEILSPNDAYNEVEEKVFDWLAAETRMVVIVTPRRRSATVYRAPDRVAVLGEDSVLDGGDVVPSWWLALSDLFA